MNRFSSDIVSQLADSIYTKLISVRCVYSIIPIVRQTILNVVLYVLWPAIHVYCMPCIIVCYWCYVSLPICVLYDTSLPFVHTAACYTYLCEHSMPLMTACRSSSTSCWLRCLDCLVHWPSLAMVCHGSLSFCYPLASFTSTYRNSIEGPLGKSRYRHTYIGPVQMAKC